MSMTNTQATQATPEQLKEARGWIWNVWGKKLADSLTDAEVIAGVQRHYDGGWAGFIADAS